MQGVQMTFIVANDTLKGFKEHEQSRYHAHTLVMACNDYDDFEINFNIVRQMHYWHPHTNTIVYYHNASESNDIISRIFFALWYYKSINSIILQYNDASEMLKVTHYSPYISDNYKLEHSYGCWTRRKITLAVRSLREDIVCTEGCHNVTLNPKLRSNQLGTCIGFETINISYDDEKILRKIQLFEDKTKNFHGFKLKAYGCEVMPFFMVNESNGSYSIGARDGEIWKTLASMMNFTIDLSLSEKTLKAPFDFERIIKQIFDFSVRKADLMLNPVYQYDLIVVDVDQTLPYKGSGLCFLTHRAGFDTTLFDVKLLQHNFMLLIEFIFCFLGIWFVFFVFNVVEKGTISFDQAGKDLVNAIRNILSVSLFKPPKKGSFKIFLFISIWSFFVMNFATQAAIISFFSAFKRGKEVETFDDVIEKGYIIEGLSSPDVMLPQTEEKFNKINSKLVPIRNLFGCVDQMANNSQRICLIDCSVGRFVERNKLNDKGEQYMHIAKDQIHSHFLTMVLQKHSALTNEYNRNMYKILEAGLINKWEQYRFADMKYESPVKSLDMSDLIGIFKCYLLLIGLSIAIFAVEVSKTLPEKTKKNLVKIDEWIKARAEKKAHNMIKKNGKIKCIDISTQTV